MMNQNDARANTSLEALGFQGVAATPLKIGSLECGKASARRPKSMRGMRDFRGLVISNFRAQRRHQHQRILHILLDSRQIQLHAQNAMVHKGTARVRKQAHRIQKIVDHQGFENI